MTKNELIEKTDKAISELVYAKSELLKAYNYYNGVRDAELFRYLEEVYGTNTPTTIHFTPLIKKHVDALIGEYLGTPIIPKVYCKDGNTISNIDREKLLKIISEVHSFLKAHLLNFILNFKEGKNTNDTLVEKLLKQIVEDVDNNFISEYEIAAQNVLEYIMLSRETDINAVMRDLFLDLLITGYAFYKVEPSIEKNNIRIRVLNPLNTFLDRNIESPYVKNSHRAVVRSWMSKTLILNKYGKEMTAADRKTINEHWESIYDSSAYYIRANTDGIVAGVEVTPGFPDGSKGRFQDFIPVYEVEWLEVEDDYIINRYETIRIGDEVYILRGKDEEVIRSVSNPSQCGLSINGLYYLNRGSEPWSLVLKCAHLLDQYDLLNFYRDNLIANSGTIGDWIDYTLIPESLGVNLPERIVKWQALKKQGIGVLDSSQEGRLNSGASPLNTIFNGYDNTVKALAIEAIQIAIESVEKVTSDITGVFKERLGQIELYDAASNVKIGQRNSFVITKLYYHLMDLIVNELLLDSLNLAKSVFKNGLTGTLILGDKYLKIFTALPEHFTLTDHDVRIITSSDAVKDLEQVRAIIPEFVKSGGLPPDIILEAITSKSLPDLKYKVKKAMLVLKEENNLMLLLAQQVEQLQQLLLEASGQLQSAQLKIQLLSNEKLQLEQYKIKAENEVKWYEARTDRDYKEKMAEEQKRRTDIEFGQLFDGNPYNDKVRQASYDH